MKKLILYLAVVLVATALSAEHCQPFGVRTFFGASYALADHPELFSLRFNTNDSCPLSYVRVVQSSNAQDFNCTVQ